MLCARRDTYEKLERPLDGAVESVKELLANIQKDMLEAARKHRDERIVYADDMKGIPQHEANLRHFLDVLGGAKPDFVPVQGVNMIKILEAMYKSAALGREIQL
jgi:predicted dehydrogenase